MLNTIILIIPILLVFVGIEWIISIKRGDRNYSGKNFAMNLAIGALDQLGALFYFVALFFVLQFSYNHFRLFTLGEQWYIWVAAYFAIDFLSYWYHRCSHRVNILWAGHITHHSSEHLNFSNGFRTSLFQGVNRILFWSILPVFGFSPLMLVITLKVSGLYDFILHTQYIPKLGFLEKILITPSHHRVHHGRNDIYIDKNYGSTLVIWDKMFGTFREETEKVEYGVKGNYEDRDPLNAVTYYYKLLYRAAKQRKSFIEKLKVLFIPPDRTFVQEKSAVFIRNEIELPNTLLNYAWFQSAVAVPGLILLLLFENMIPAGIFSLLAFAGVSSTCVGALILNRDLSERFFVFENFRNISLTIVFAYCIWQRPDYFLLVPIYFAIVSLFLLRNAKEKMKMHTQY